MAIGQETESRGLGGFMQRSQKQWEQQRMIEAQEEMRRQREMQAEEAKKEQSQDSGKEKKDSRPASQTGLNTPSSSISVLGSGGVTMPFERRENVGVGGSTGRVTHYDASKAPPYLDAIADKYGINRDDFKRMAFVESGFDPHAGAKGSSAKGLFQFLDGTARNYNLRNPYDGPANAEAAARLWNDNKASLSKSLGREPTAGELYLAHQQGAGGAAELLKNPNAPAASIVGTKAVTGNGGRAGMSAGEFASKWTSRFDGSRAMAADGATPRNRDAGNPQSPVKVASASMANDATPSSATPAASTGGARYSNGGSTYAESIKNAQPAPATATTGVMTDAQVTAAVGRGEKIIYDAQDRPIGTSAGTLPTSGASPATPAATTPGSTTAPATGAAPPTGEPPFPPRRPEMGPTMSEMTPPAAQAQPGQPAAQQESGNFVDDIGKGIGSFFDSLTGNGEPIKDKYGRTWDGFEGWVDPKAGAEKRPSEVVGSVQTNDSAGSMLDQSSAATAATADSSKSILSDMPDIGSAFTPALNFFSSIFG